MDAATKIDLAIAHMNLVHKVKQVTEKVQDPDALRQIEQWVAQFPAPLDVVVRRMSYHPNDDMRDMYIKRQEAADMQTPVFVRTMSNTSLQRIRRKMRLVDHPWHGCTLEWEEDESGAMAVYLNGHPTPQEQEQDETEAWR